jgi:hypothetical protein
MNESKQFHEWTNGNGEVLILRRIPPSRRTYNEFQWPTGVGTRVECPDWNPKPICGGGLHGWPLGFGLGESSAFSIVDDVWLVLGAKPEDVVGELDGGAKCKCREGIIRYEGDFAGAVSFVSTEFANCVAAMAGGDGARSSANGDYAKSSANGDYARSSAAGDCARSSAAGYCATSSAAGDYARSSAAGDCARSSAASNGATSSAAGYCATSSANGDYARSSAAGDCARSSAAGYCATSSAAGYCATSSANGYCATSSAAGDYARSSAAGDCATVEAVGGDNLAAVVGLNGKVRVGERGAFAIAYQDRCGELRFLTGKAGENGIAANVWYHVVDGALVEVTQCG